MFFSLALVAVGEQLYGRFFDLTVHAQVIYFTWLIFILLGFLLNGLNPHTASYNSYYNDYPNLDTSERCHDDSDSYRDSYTDELEGKNPTGGMYIPQTLQNFSEGTFEYLSSLVKDQIGLFQYKLWTPYVGSIFLFIFTANWLGALLPWKLFSLPEGEFAAPTNDINTTLALSLLTSISYFYTGIAKSGVTFFIRYISPTPVFFPITLLEDCTKPLSLTFRLFGNVLAEEIVLSVLCVFVPVAVPLPVMLLGLFSASVQALVFSTLSVTYLSESLEM
jgi:F-type H+-transporting ATPase subunit a